MSIPRSDDGTAVASIETVRRAFPALLREHRNRPVAYFDGPGGTQVPYVVSDAMIDYLLYHNANTHWRYPTSQETDEAIARSRQWLAWFLNASPREVAFGANMTTITFHVARSARARPGDPGDEIVTTELDHHANVAPWQAVARERGVTIRRVPFVRDTGELDWDAFAGGARRRTRVSSRSAPPRTRSAPSPTSRAPPVWRTTVGRSRVRRCGPLRAARARGRRPARLRFPGVLGLQVLWTARRRALRPPRSARIAGRPQARAGAGRGARPARDRNAESRGHRGGGTRHSVRRLAERRDGATRWRWQAALRRCTRVDRSSPSGCGLASGGFAA